MADYRDWCGYCHKEIVFGSHAKDCEGVRKVREAKRERQNAEDEARHTMEKMSEDELVAFIVKLTEDRIALDTELTRIIRRMDFIRSHVFLDRGHGFMDKVRDTLQERGHPGRMFF